MCPRPVCLSPVPRSHGAPPDGGGLTSGLTSCRLLPGLQGLQGSPWPEAAGRVSESSPEANPKDLPEGRGLVGTWRTRVCPSGCSPQATEGVSGQRWGLG